MTVSNAKRELERVAAAKEERSRRNYVSPIWHRYMALISADVVHFDFLEHLLVVADACEEGTHRWDAEFAENVRNTARLLAGGIIGEGA